MGIKYAGARTGGWEQTRFYSDKRVSRRQKRVS
jgi:hypothetical protein